MVNIKYYGEDEKNNCGCEDIKQLCYPNVRLKDYKNLYEDTQFISFSAKKLCNGLNYAKGEKCTELVARARGECHELFRITPYKIDHNNYYHFDFQDLLKNQKNNLIEFEIIFNNKCKVYYGINLIQCGLHGNDFNIEESIERKECESLELDQDYVKEQIEGCNDC